MKAATAHGIPVGNTPGVLTETTAELALALTFAAARRVVEGDKFMRAGQYKGWLPSLFVGGARPFLRFPAFSPYQIWSDPLPGRIRGTSLILTAKQRAGATARHSYNTFYWQCCDGLINRNW